MMTNEKMNATVLEIKALEAQIKELEAYKDSLKDELKSEMDERKVDKVDTGMFKISYIPVETSRFDSTKFKTEHPDVYGEYLKSSTYLRMDIR